MFPLSDRRQRPPSLSPLPVLHRGEMLHVNPAHPGGALRDMPQDDDGPPLLDVLRPDAVSDLIGGIAGHAEAAAALHGDPGSRGAHSDRLEGELRGERE